MAAPAHAEDLALVRACLAGEPRARARFEAQFGACLRAGVLRIHSDAAFVDETLQQLRSRLLTGPDAKLGAYSGSGPLRAWLKLVASRAALDALRSEARRRRHERAAAAAWTLSAADPELGVDRTRHGVHFGHALRSVLRALAPQDRALLKLRFSDGLELEAIARKRGVHRVTVARWLTALYARLSRAMQSELSQRGASLSASELHGLGQVVASQLAGTLDSWLQRSLRGYEASRDAGEGGERV
jgi:RNA polymerase sigma-70 factor, ECF subfamily